MRSLSILSILLLTACNAALDPAPMDPIDPIDPPPEGPTYAQDVAPLLSEHCGACHVAGGIAPFALTTYDEVAPRAASIQYAVVTRQMPPWMPGGATPALMHDRSLDDDVIRTISAWVEAGAPEGDPSRAAPLVPPKQIPFSDPDLAVEMPEPYTPSPVLTDDYRCFMIDLGMTEDRMLVAYRITPGNAMTVHHVITTLFDASERAALEAKDAESPGPGWTCFGGVGDAGRPSGSLGSWVPGVSAVVFPEGTGTEVRAGSLAVMQVHYNTLLNDDPDQTKIELAFAPRGAVIEPLRAVRAIDRMLNIPPGATEHVEENTLPVPRRLFADGEGFIVGASGHMHTLGIRYELNLIRGNSTETLLEIPAWDFHWQGSYQFVDPIPISSTDRVQIRCTYDNSSAHRALQGMDPEPITVTWGEGTHDEMCLGSLAVVDQLP